MDKYEGHCDVYPATRLGIHISSVELCTRTAAAVWHHDGRHYECEQPRKAWASLQTFSRGGNSGSYSLFTCPLTLQYEASQ